MKRKASFLLMALLLLFRSAPGFGDIIADLDTLFSRAPRRGSVWGFSAQSLEGRQMAYGRDGERLLLPASLAKLFTTAVALVRLGPDFRWVTGLYTDGAVAGATIEGNVIIRGTGDPTICDGLQDGRGIRVFEAWAAKLRARGIQEIRGDIVGDDSLFGPEYRAPGWSADDILSFRAPPVSALAVNENTVEVVIAPGKRAGEAATVEVRPEADYPRIIRSVRTVRGAERSVSFSRGEGGALRVSGRIGVQSVPWTTWVPVEDPGLYGAAVMKRCLEEQGIAVTGRATGARVTDYGKAELLATYVSRPLHEIIIYVNKLSDNLAAELIFRTVGNICGDGGSCAASSRAVIDGLTSMGLATDGLLLLDGSGLSRLNLVSAGQVTALLTYMYGHPDFGYFCRSLAVAGVDGTLKRRMKKSIAEGKVYAKSGSMANTLALAGYVETAEGGLRAFAVITNNYPGSRDELRAFHDLLCIRLAE